MANVYYHLVADWQDRADTGLHREIELDGVPNDGKARNLDHILLRRDRLKIGDEALTSPRYQLLANTEQYKFTVRSTVRSNVYSVLAVYRAASPRRFAAAGLEISSSMTPAHAELFRGGTSRPLVPSVIRSRFPPAAEATTGLPRAIASSRL